LTVHLPIAYIEVMRKTVRHITSMIVLLSLLALFVAPAIAAIAPAAKAEKSCCEGCGQKEKAPDPAPCSTADCPLLLCLAAALVEPVVLQVLVRETVAIYNSFLPGPIPDPFAPSIFHPPSVA